jgi:hypothetical protein
MSGLDKNTVVTPVYKYNTNRMIFQEPSSGSIPDSTPKIEYKRINISTKNEDGSIGDLILPTTRLFSFGVSENKSQETGNVNGWTFPLCLWSRNGPTDEEQNFTDTFNAIVEKCIDHLVENKEEIELYDLTKSDLEKSKGGLNPLYWKKEKYTDPKTNKSSLRVVPGSGPTLYTKLIYSKKNEKFLSQFYDSSDESINPIDLMGKYCYTTAAVKIESIFIGSKVSLQIKLYEAVVEPTDNGMKRMLLSRPKIRSVFDSTVSSETDNDDSEKQKTEVDKDELEDDSLSEDEPDPDPKPVPKKKVTRVVKKKA